MGVETRSGAATRRGTYREAFGAEPGGVAGMEAEAGKHHGISDQAIDAVAFAERRGDRLDGVEHGGADQWPGPIDCPQFDKLALAGRGHQEGAKLDHFGNPCAAAGEPLAQRRCRRLGAGADLQVAAQNLAPVGRQPGIGGGAQGADRGDHRDTQRKAEQHDPQAPDPAAEFPARQPQRQHQTGTPVRTVAVTRPSAMWICRKQRAARPGSWVISSSVAPVSARRRNSRSITA